MKPLYPIIISKKQLTDSTWLNDSEFASLILHIKNLCADYPSLLMAYSADFDSKSNAQIISETITNWGINVFMPDYAVPLSVISYAMTTKSMPIGLYIEEASQKDTVRIIPISTHGGLFDEQDLKTSYISESKKKGVVGSTDLSSLYIKHLAGFADPYIEKGLSFSSLNVPFVELFEAMKSNENLKILFERSSSDEVATINNNGCHLNIKKNSEQISTAKIAENIAKYLKNERFSSGTIYVPNGYEKDFNKYGEVVEFEGNDYDLSYTSAFSDLFLSFSNEGMLAFQGSSCLGDAFLAAIYYLESLR